MFTTLCLVLTSLFSTFNPAGMDWNAVAERIAPTEQASVASVQLELLPDADGAEQLALDIQSQLDAKTLDLEVYVETVRGEFELPASYRIGIGPFTNFEDAERARGQLDALGLDGFIRATGEVTGC